MDLLTPGAAEENQESATAPSVTVESQPTEGSHAADPLAGRHDPAAAHEQALHRQTWGLVGVIFAQGAFVIAVLQILN